MADNFVDNVAYGGSTLSVSGNGIQVGDGAAGAKSIVFTNNNGALHLAGNATGNATINLPAGGGTLLASSQGILSVSAGAAVITSGQIIFSNSNGVSFGLNGSTITASAAGGGGGSVSYVAVGNTTQNSSTTLSNTVSFNALGGMSMGYSNGSIQVSAPATSSLVGIGGINLSSNGSTISVSLAPIVILEPYQINNVNSTLLTPGLGSLYFQPFLAEPINSGRINVIDAFSVSLQASNSTSFGTGTTGSRGATYNFSRTMALYSQGSGTNSSRLESMWSNTWTMGLVQTVSVNSAAGPNLSVTNAGTLSYVGSIGTNGSYTTTSLTASGSTSIAASTLNSNSVSSVLTSIQNMISGTMVMPVGFNTSISAGNYWLMMGQSTASTSAGTSASFVTYSNHHVIVGQQTQARLFGQTVFSSGSQMIPGQGVFSAASASPPSTVAFSDIRSVASNFIYYFNIVNSNA